LSIAAWLVRAPEREEWLAEWRAELWYVRSGSRTAFCRGAIRDALWMRLHSPAPVHLQSPWRCLAFLGVLAGLSLLFAFWLPLPHEIVFSPKLPEGLVTISGIPVDDYRQLPGDRSQVSFFGPAEFRGGDLAVALASRNLFELLRIPVPVADAGSAALVLRQSAWRQHFHSDPHAVGRRLTVAGRSAQVAAVVSDRVWRLPGSADAWLLVDEPSLAGEGAGYVVAQVGPSTRHIGRFTCIPLSEPRPLMNFLLVMLFAGAVLPAVTSLSLGEYPENGHPPSRGTAMRRWIFLAVKLVLILPIVLFGSLDVFSLIAVGLQAHGLIVSTVVGLRWALMDQRRRCPVCLRILSNPASIGEPSHTLLEWYGTELVCARGHGLLHVPEIRNSYSEQRWLHLDSSWSSLF
jgi:hypothetical protein